MKTILVLDSNKRHRSIFMQIFNGHNVMAVSNADATICLLEERKWDWLFLGYGFDKPVVIKPGQDIKTGYDVGMWLKEYPEFKPKHIVIHTVDPIVSGIMNTVLPDAVHIPEAWLYTFKHIRSIFNKAKK